MPLTVRFSVPVLTRTTFRVLLRIASLAAIALLVTCVSLHAQTEVSSAERALFDDLNRERAAQGLAALQWDAALAAAAREHASQMAQRNVLSHQLPGEPRFRIAPPRLVRVSASLRKILPWLPTPQRYMPHGCSRRITVKTFLIPNST